MLGGRAAEASADAPAGMSWEGLRTLFSVLDDAHFALAGRALQLVDWDRTHQFCGRCGTPTRGESATSACASARPASSRPTRGWRRRSWRSFMEKGKRAPARAQPALSARHVQRARRLRRARRVARAVPGARSARRKSACASTNMPLLRQPVVAVPAFADDRVRLRVARAARLQPQAARNRGSKLVRSIAIAETSEQNLDRSQIDRRGLSRADDSRTSKTDHLGGFERIERELKSAVCAARRGWKARPATAGFAFAFWRVKK